jgi:hypothetical protein
MKHMGEVTTLRATSPSNTPQHLRATSSVNRRQASVASLPLFRKLGARGATTLLFKMGKSKSIFVYFHYDKLEGASDEEVEHGHVRSDQLQGFEGKKIEDFRTGMKANVLDNSKRKEIWPGTIVDFDGKCKKIILKSILPCLLHCRARIHSLNVSVEVILIDLFNCAPRQIKRRALSFGPIMASSIPLDALIAIE